MDNGLILHPSWSPWIPKRKTGFSVFLLIQGLIGFFVSEPGLQVILRLWLSNFYLEMIFVIKVHGLSYVKILYLKLVKI